jgi:glucosyl-3-phosphoglycerate phosphatase
VLWRHGRTSWNDDRRFQGQTDIELDDHGRRQARRTARLLAALPPDALLSSDLTRARATAAELATLTGLPVSVDPRLRETHAGRWEGLLAQEIEATDAPTWQAWLAGDPTVRPGGGETRAEVADRAVAAVDHALPQVRTGGVLVVATHGGTARALIGRLLGLPEAEWHVLGGLANCSWSVLAESEHGWRLEEHNAGRLPEPVAGTDDA